MSVHTLELELETGRLKVLDAEKFPILRHWYLVYRQGKRLSPTAQEFRDYVLSFGDETRQATNIVSQSA